MPSVIWNGVVIVDAAMSWSAAWLAPQLRNVARELVGPLTVWHDGVTVEP